MFEGIVRSASALRVATLAIHLDKRAMEEALRLVNELMEATAKISFARDREDRLGITLTDTLKGISMQVEIHPIDECENASTNKSEAKATQSLVLNGPIMLRDQPCGIAGGRGCLPMVRRAILDLCAAPLGILRIDGSLRPSIANRSY